MCVVKRNWSREKESELYEMEGKRDRISLLAMWFWAGEVPMYHHMYDCQKESYIFSLGIFELPIFLVYQLLLQFIYACMQMISETLN